MKLYMKELLTVISFTIKEMVRKKAFLISTVIIVLLIILGFNVPKIIKAIQGEDVKEKIEILDEQNILEGNIEALKQTNLENYDIQISNNSKDEVKKKIENEEIDSALFLEKFDNTLKITYLVKNAKWISSIPEELITAVNTIYSNIQIGKLGLSQEQLEILSPKVETNVEQTDEEENLDQGNVFLMMAISFLLSMAIIFFTAQVALSITTEKTSKIVETLATSTSPKIIVIGKTVGVGIVGLMQVILIVTTIIISANVFLEKEFLDPILEMINITPFSVFITLIYFILGFFTYAFLYALTGSLVSKPEDIQSANTPVSMLAMVGFYLGYFSIAIDPTGSVSSFAAIFPFSAPFCMPSRIMKGLAGTGDIVLSIVILIAVVAIIAKIAISIYSSAILNYGSKLSLKDAVKLYKQK